MVLLVLMKERFQLRKIKIISIFLALVCLLAIVLVETLPAQNPRLKGDLNLYVVRCTQCHPIEMATPVVDFLPSEVMVLTRRMKDMPDSLIREDEVERLYQITLYKIYVSQRDELQQKLNALSPEQKKEEIEALKKALAPYK